MLTNEEIKNLRIGDAIYVEDQVYKVTNLSMHNITTNYTISFSHCFLLDPDNFISLNPPKTKKKYWLWAFRDDKTDHLECTYDYYDDDFRNTSGDLIKVNYYFKQKLEYSMIEIEES